MTRTDAPQTRGRFALAHADVTPPVGIYHRMWGAALHDRATGVHRPLRATAMWLEPHAGDASRAVVLVAVDHCLLDRAEIELVQAKVSAATGVNPGQVLVTVSHTHGAGFMSRSRAGLPGGDKIAPYLDAMAETCGRVAAEAKAAAQPATLVYGTTRCDLAKHRDFWDTASKQFVCGFNPGGTQDETVTLVKATADGGRVLGTVVNYACHPTTLAWENTLISPDYVGAMRDAVEANTGAPCLFLQGASGELGPREGFVGDTAVADRNGRQLGFAALAGLETLPPPGTFFGYTGPVVSGATLGAWAHQPLTPAELAGQEAWAAKTVTVPVAYRHDLFTLEETRAELARWTAEEEKARAANDTPRVRDCRAQAERMTRQIGRLEVWPAGRAYPLVVSLLRLGGSVWVFTPGELYQSFQVELRKRFPGHALVITTMTNDWQPGYLPAANAFGYGIYQETIAGVGPGALEALTEAVSREIRVLVEAARPGARGVNPGRPERPRYPVRVPHRRLGMFLPAAAVALLGLSAAQTTSAPPFELKDGDRVVWIGNTLAEREQRYGYWETALHAAFPKANFTVRNLGWSGDTVWGEARAGFDPPAKGYERLVSLTKELKPTVLLVSYGANESFAGEAGVEAFQKQYAKLLDDLKPTGARLTVLMAPIPALGTDTTPADKARDEEYKRYAKAVHAVAYARGHQYLDLRAVVGLHQITWSTPVGRVRHPGPYLSDNGVHLTGHGYRTTADAFAGALRGSLDSTTPFDPLEPLRLAVAEKNQLFFYRWRPQNETYLFGFRKHEQGKNAKEVAEFDPLVSAAEKTIAELKAKLVK